MLKNFLITTFLTSAVCCNSLNAIIIENDTDEEVKVHAIIHSNEPMNNKIYFSQPEFSIAPKNRFTIAYDMLRNHKPGDPIYVFLSELSNDETLHGLGMMDKGKQQVDNDKINSPEEFNDRIYKVTSLGISK